MRRCKDDWVNATQILKCCNFPKAKRTKILEKGVQQGLHEKIQGGYGRFQGTWIPLADAQRLAANYGVTPELAPVLYLDTSDPNMVIPKKMKQVNKDGTPVKRKYTKKAKKPEEIAAKKAKTDLASQEQFHPHSSFDTISRGHTQMPQGSLQANTPQQQLQFQMSQGNQQLPPTFTQADFLAMGNNNMPAFTAHNQAIQSEFQNYQMQFQRFQQQQNQQVPQNKLYRGNVPYSQVSGDAAAQPQMAGFHHTKLPLSQSTNETNWSQDEHQKDSDTSISSNEEHLNGEVKSNMFMMKQGTENLAPDMNSPKEQEEYNAYAAQLLKFFSEDNSNIPYFLHNPPYDFNINEAIDDEGHTPLHWSASIGNYALIHLLISKGANPLVVNSYGLNPLSKLISFNNCYELKNFPNVLDDLELCLINTDINGRTPLHYLCQFSKVKSKYESLRYYLGIILAKLTSLSKNANNKAVNLLKNVIDHQDVNGDTCLHLAAKSGCNKIFKFLTGYGARDDLVNVNNETAKYLNVQYSLLNNGGTFDQQNENYQPIESLQQQTNEGQTPQRQNQILATPIQQNYRNNSVETPDTQRTTVQDDDIDEDDVHDSARVNKDQFDQLIKNQQHVSNADDNKENIFIDDTLKAYGSISTPLPTSKNNPQPNTTSSSHQPLAVISERTVENTPIRSDDKKKLFGPSTPQTYKPHPPKLDDEGRIIEQSKHESDDDMEIDQPKLLMIDLSSMLNGMVNSLSDSYGTEMSKLNKTYKQLNQVLQQKEKSNSTSLSRLEAMLGKCGIESFTNIDEGKTVLQDAIKHHEQELDSKGISLRQLLEKSQAYQLANLVQREELNLEVGEDEGKDEDRWSCAIELTNLQLKRNNIINQVTEKIKTYGLDSKMYKYRKLISLSCGLKVEDIDGLIDGIEESLMETSMT